jgi:hypothetical protein
MDMELGSQHTSHAVIVKTPDANEEIRIMYWIPRPLEELHKYRLVGHVGFLEPNGDVPLRLTFDHDGPGSGEESIVVDPGVGPQKFEIPASGFIFGGQLNIVRQIVVTTPDGPPETPVAIFGLRLIDDGS